MNKYIFLSIVIFPLLGGMTLATKEDTGRMQHLRLDHFSDLDHNEDEIIARKEWRDTDRSFKGLDRDRDEQLSHREFYNRQQYPVAVFWELDKNSDGKISRGEWRSTNDVFTRLDINEDNLLNENEFNSR